MNINYYSKEVYGQTLYYFATDRQRRLWRELTGKKTVTLIDLDHLTELTGATFTRVFESEN